MARRCCFLLAFTAGAMLVPSSVSLGGPREYGVYCTGNPPAIDGNLRDDIWRSVPWAGGFTGLKGEPAEVDAVAVNFSASSLAAGTYSGAITVTAADAENSPVTIPVTLKVTKASGGGGGGGGGGCSLAAGPAGASGALGWLVPYLGLAAAYALSRLTRRRRAK